MRKEDIMIKKIYDKPQMKVVNLKLVSLICTSSPTQIPVRPDEEMKEDEDFE